MAVEEFTLEQAEEEIASLRGTLDRVAEILSLTNSTDQPVTPIAGAALYALNGTAYSITDNGLAGSLCATQADAAVTTVTAASATNLSSVYTVPANDASVGTTYRLECGGNGVWGSTQQSLAFGLYLGGTLIGVSTTVAATAFPASDSLRWRATGTLTCISTGAGGTWQAIGAADVTDITVVSIGQSAGDVSLVYGNATAASADTTVAQTFSLRATWGSTTGAPTITNRFTTFERLGP